MVFDVDSYLNRLGTRWRRPSIDYLRELQRAHQRNLPIENFDVFLGIKRPWDIESLYDKVIGQRRGGLGIELNALFGELLTQLGFRCIYIKVSLDPKNQIRLIIWPLQPS